MPKNLKAYYDKYNHSDKGIARSRRQAAKRKEERRAARIIRNAAKAADKIAEDQHWAEGQQSRDAYAEYLTALRKEKKRRQDRPSTSIKPHVPTAFEESQDAVLKQLLNKS